MFSNNNNNLQFDIILSNEAIALESFIQIFGMSPTYFSEKSAIPKKIENWLTGIGTTVVPILETSSSFSKIPRLQTPIVSIHKNLP